MNPVDAFLSYEQGLQKEAVMSPAVKGALTMGLISAGTLAAGTVATGAAQDLLDMARNAVTRSIHFNRMVKENPDIKKLDRNKTQAYFNTLHRFSPEMSGDPVVAASWVKRMGEFDYIDPATVQQLVSTSERMRSAKSQQRIPPFMLAQAATMTGLERYKEMRSDLTPAQQALVQAQSVENLRGIREKAQLEDQYKSLENAKMREAQLKQYQHGVQMAKWKAGLPRQPETKRRYNPPETPTFQP